MEPKRKKPSPVVENPIFSNIPKKRRSKAAVAVKSTVEPMMVVDSEIDSTARFPDQPIPDSEARRNWPDRYKPIVIKKRDVSRRKRKKDDDDDDVEDHIRARCHYRRAIVDERDIYELNDDAYVHYAEGEEPHICKIVEMFEGTDGKLYFSAQWFYRVRDTVIGTHEEVEISDKRVFLSDVIDANELITLVRKLDVLMIPLDENSEEIIASTSNYDYYCDMNYQLAYSTFVALKPDAKMLLSEGSTITSENDVTGRAATVSDDEEGSRATRAQRTDATLLDLYSGCGAMSTGLCMGAHLAGLDLVTKWAVDLNEHACKSLKHNHSETEVRNESAEDFLSLLKEWEKLCLHFSLRTCRNSEKYANLYWLTSVEDDEDDGKGSSNKDGDGDVFTVDEIVGISFGNPETENTKKTKKTKKKIKNDRLYFKVRWLGYKEDDDTWEPIEGLSNCREKIKEFVQKGYESSILPLPGTVDVVCGGPPCQGISGFNRYRKKEKPLEDEKNKQLLVYMNIVEFLKPKYVLMENVVDILRFADGYLARYAVGRLVQMNYQTRMGLMAAGAYGLAQFRMRFFLWGARSSEMLPQFPLPTHNLVMRGTIPKDFENNVVAYNEGHTVKLGEILLLGDVISDLPAVTNNEVRNVMPYDQEPKTDFQKYIRLGKEEMMSGSLTKSKYRKRNLYDHHPLNLNSCDSKRVAWVPKKKNGSFRDFPGVIVGSNKKVEWDPNVPRVYLDDSKHPLVPNYAMRFCKGASHKPFGRLWWDETVSTVVTRAEPHNQVILHPHQDRVLTVRENARLQGFPDFYRLFGPTKEKYTQVGNAVAVPVARALGYSLGQAFQGLIHDDPLLVLPEGFPNCRDNLPSESSQ